MNIYISTQYINFKTTKTIQIKFLKLNLVIINIINIKNITYVNENVIILDFKSVEITKKKKNILIF